MELREPPLQPISRRDFLRTGTLLTLALPKLLLLAACGSSQPAAKSRGEIEALTPAAARTPVSPTRQTSPASPAIGSRNAERQATIAGIEANRKAQGRIYDRPNTFAQGHRYLETALLVDMMQALEATKHPFLSKIVRDIRILTGPNLSPEYPPLTAAKTQSPLPILESDSITSFVSAMPWKDNRPENMFILNGRNGDRGLNPLSGVEYAISLGRDQNVRNSSLLAQSFFLAKEILSFTLGLGYERDFDKLMGVLKLGSLIALNGSAITDISFRQRAASTVMHLERGDNASEVVKVLDLVPLLLLGAVGADLQGQNLFPVQDNQVLGNFSKANRLVTNPNRNISRNLPTIIPSFMSQWIREGTLLPSLNLTTQTAQGEILNAATRLSPEIDTPPRVK